MFELKVRRSFSAAHQLRGYQGKCEALHGHTYRVEAVVRVKELDECGLGIDFKELKRNLDEILEPLDHAFLNELPPFERENPSAEMLARFIYGQLKSRLPAGAALAEVTVWESDDAGATYLEPE